MKDNVFSHYVLNYKKCGLPTLHLNTYPVTVTQKKDKKL